MHIFCILCIFLARGRRLQSTAAGVCQPPPATAAYSESLQAACCRRGRWEMLELPRRQDLLLACCSGGGGGKQAAESERTAACHAAAAADRRRPPPTASGPPRRRRPTPLPTADRGRSLQPTASAAGSCREQALTMAMLELPRRQDLLRACGRAAGCRTLHASACHRESLLHPA